MVSGFKEIQGCPHLVHKVAFYWNQPTIPVYFKPSLNEPQWLTQCKFMHTVVLDRLGMTGEYLHVACTNMATLVLVTVFPKCFPSGLGGLDMQRPGICITWRKKNHEQMQNDLQWRRVTVTMKTPTLLLLCKDSVKSTGKVSHGDCQTQGKPPF